MKQVLILCTAFILLLSSCDMSSGSGNVVTEKRTVGNFTAINISNGFEVEVKIGAVQEIRIDADDNIMAHIKTEVSGNTLVIKIEDMHNINDGHLKAYITMPDLKSIEASGGTNVKVLDVVKTDSKMDFDASGGAEINAEVETPEVAAEASGGATIRLTGKTKHYTADASGGGRIKSMGLLSETTNAQASGGGGAEVHGSISINADASGGGTIKYTGDGELKKEESSGGSVNRE